MSDNEDFTTARNRIPEFDSSEMAWSSFRARNESPEDPLRREAINRSSNTDGDSSNNGGSRSSAGCSGLGLTMSNTSMTTGEGGGANIVQKKKLNTNAERLEAIRVAKNLGICYAGIQFGVTESTIRRWIKCERLIETKDEIDSKYYLQSHNVPHVVKKRLAESIKRMEELWPIDIEVVSQHFRYLAKKLGFPELSVVPGVANFLRVFKIEYKLNGAFVVK